MEIKEAFSWEKTMPRMTTEERDAAIQAVRGSGVGVLFSKLSEHGGWIVLCEVIGKDEWVTWAINGPTRYAGHYYGTYAEAAKDFNDRK